LLIHGNGNTIRNNSPIIYDFQKKYKVIAVDCRSYGKSIDKGDSLSDEMIADDINELLIKMNLYNINILGISSGANSALWLAAKYPNLVKKAAIDGATLTSSAETIGEYWNQHHKNLLDSLNNIQIKTEDDKIKLKNIKREYNYMTFEDLHKIQSPTLIISGDYDVIKPSHSVQIFENIKKSYLYIQPSSGHLIAWIYKNEFVKNIDQETKKILLGFSGLEEDDDSREDFKEYLAASGKSSPDINDSFGSSSSSKDESTFSLASLLGDALKKK
jgi:pimeloyl-ACP methyl ester carboxylesterase